MAPSRGLTLSPRRVLTTVSHIATHLVTPEAVMLLVYVSVMAPPMG